jgi:Double-GTPase 1
MDTIRKNNILLNCNTIDTQGIINLIQNGDITLDEFVNAGLDGNTIVKLSQEKKRQEINGQKGEALNKILKGRITAEEIKGLVNSKTITFDDLLDEGLPQRTVNALKLYCSTEIIRRAFTIDQLKPMEEGRTDIYFIGVAGSGKSTMLAGLLKAAHSNGVLLPDTYNNEGSKYQADLMQDLNRGLLPKRTEDGSYNYVALSINDVNNKRHPFNIVDVPGENYRSIFENAEVSKLLRYINNSNKKILIFVIDSLAHDNGYFGGNQLDQSIAYVNILQMFKSNGVLEDTDAIYLVVNKFDAIKESRYSMDDRPKGDLALEFLNGEFLGLIRNCQAAREETKNYFTIKVMPFSIGSLSYGSILNSFNKEFANTMIKQLIRDSFIIKGGVGKVFK